MDWRQRLFGPSQKVMDDHVKRINDALRVTQRGLNASFDDKMARKEAKLNGLHNALEDQCLAVRALTDDAAKQITDVKTQQFVVDQMLDQLRAELSNLDAAQNTLAEQVGEALDQRMEETVNSIDERINNVNTKLDQLAANQQAFVAELQQVANRFGQLDAIMPQLIARMSELSGLPSAVEQAFASIGQEVMDLRKRLGDPGGQPSSIATGRDPGGRDPVLELVNDDSLMQQQLQMQMQLATMLQSQLARADAQLAAARADAQLAAAAATARDPRGANPRGANPLVPDPWGGAPGEPYWGGTPGGAPQGFPGQTPEEQTPERQTPDWRTPASQRAMMESSPATGGVPYAGDPPRIEYPAPPAVDLEYVIVDPATEQITGYGPRT